MSDTDDIQLTSEDLDKIDDMFDMMDINSDGSISLSELTREMAKKGNKPRNMEIQRIFNEADIDGNGEIDWREFLEMTKNQMKAEKLRNQPLEKLKNEPPQKSSLKRTQNNRSQNSDKEKEKEDKIDKYVHFDSGKKPNTFEKDKKLEILKMFNRMDPNGNGYVELGEFMLYMRNQASPLSKERARHLYKSIKSSTTLDSSLEDKGITFQDMITYFENEVLEEEPEPIHMDNINPQDYDMSDLFAINILTNNRLDVNSYTTLAGGINRNRKDTVRDTLKNMIEDSKSDEQSLEQKQRGRWEPFASFKRRVDRRTVMHSPSGIIKDLLPGNYSYADLVKFDDLPDIKPERTIIQDVIWIDAELNSPGQLVFPDNFDGVIETDIATTETLGYYGAFLGESTESNLTLESRHVLQDFTYSPEYFDTWVVKGAGGPGLEKHDFAHLDCPLGPMSKSGYFIIAKWADEHESTLEITAFQIPTRHTIYTPGGVIHTNDYLQGTYRTMLADGPVNQAKISPLPRFTFKRN